jgi:hypothetical protein
MKFALLAALLTTLPLSASAGVLDYLGKYGCCGIADCGVVSPSAIHAVEGGYFVDGKVNYFKEPQHGAGELGPFDHSEFVFERVPYSEARPSPDGSYWRCKYPSGARRCFFAPQPSN